MGQGLFYQWSQGEENCWNLKGAKEWKGNKQRKCGNLQILPVDINVSGHCTQKGKQSELEVGIMDTNRKIFLLTYGTPLMDVGPLHKYLGTLANTTSAEKV